MSAASRSLNVVFPVAPLPMTRTRVTSSSSGTLQRLPALVGDRNAKFATYEFLELANRFADRRQQSRIGSNRQRFRSHGNGGGGARQRPGASVRQPRLLAGPVEHPSYGQS